jgi:hypothetical protein
MGVAELPIILVCCGLPLILTGGAGLVLALIKLGVIGHYWLKGEGSVQDDGDYTLDQSTDASN